MFGLPIKLVAYLIAVAVLIGAATTIYVHIKREGYRDAIEDVRKATDDANARAIEGARTVDACFAAGGVWSASSGKCLRPAN